MVKNLGKVAEEIHQVEIDEKGPSEDILVKIERGVEGEVKRKIL